MTLTLQRLVKTLTKLFASHVRERRSRHKKSRETDQKLN